MVLAASCEEMSDFARLRRLMAVASVPYVNCKPFSDGTGPLVNWTIIVVVASFVHPRPRSTRTTIICGEMHCALVSAQRQV